MFLYAFITCKDCFSAQAANSTINTSEVQKVSIEDIKSVRRLEAIVKSARVGEPISLSREEIKFIIDQARDTNTPNSWAAFMVMGHYARKYNDLRMFLDESLKSSESVTRQNAICAFSIMAQYGENISAILESFLSRNPQSERDGYVLFCVIGAYDCARNIDDIEKGVKLAFQHENWGVRDEAINLAYRTDLMEREPIRNMISEMQKNDPNDDVRRTAGKRLADYQRDVEQFNGYRWANEIMQEFYSILTRPESPTETEEEKFFGKKSLAGGDSSVRAFARKQDKYKLSKTIVWDLLRDNRSMFFPKGTLAFNSLRISNIFTFRSLYGRRPFRGQNVLVYFDDKDDMGKIHYHEIVFEFNEDKHQGIIDIDKTWTGGCQREMLCDYFRDKFYPSPKK